MRAPSLDDWSEITDGVSDAALLQLLRVNRTTLTRWRDGRARMPHAAQELCRITFRGKLPPRGTLWQGWSIGHDGRLYAPDLARGFTPADLHQLHWLMQTRAWKDARAETFRKACAAPSPSVPQDG